MDTKVKKVSGWIEGALKSISKIYGVYEASDDSERIKSYTGEMEDQRGDIEQIK